MDQGLRKFKQ